MIPKNKIEDATKNFANSGVWQCPVSFKKGVSFAEKELENLAVEFAEWLEDMSGGFNLYNVEDGPATLYSNSELFEIFKKEKYEYEH